MKKIVFTFISEFYEVTLQNLLLTSKKECQTSQMKMYSCNEKKNSLKENDDKFPGDTFIT